MKNRFDLHNDTVKDFTTGLMWTKDAGLSEFPLTWKEAFGFVEMLNQKAYGGYVDWRLPNRRELFLLADHCCINPALPQRHFFENVFHGYYWTASTCARLPVQAWYVHFGGAKVYRGMKSASNMVWPVRVPDDSCTNVFLTGQSRCYDEKGNEISCDDSSLQKDALVSGIKWPQNRFVPAGDTVFDRLFGLTWTKKARFGRSFLSWDEAQLAIEHMNRKNTHGFDDWRIPGIRELESLTDLGRHSPAICANHPFTGVSDFYWSNTTSMYESRYAWAYYAKDGAVGVGFKQNPEFSLWPVRGKGLEKHAQ